jgi:hypothetical protein
MTKYRQVITLSGWQNGSGTSYTQCYGNDVGDFCKLPTTADDADWSWWNTDGKEVDECGDTQITVAYYDASVAEDETDDAEPIVTVSKWENDLIRERQ